MITLFVFEFTIVQQSAGIHEFILQSHRTSLLVLTSVQNMCYISTVSKGVVDDVFDKWMSYTSLREQYAKRWYNVFSLWGVFQKVEFTHWSAQMENVHFNRMKMCSVRHPPCSTTKQAVSQTGLLRTGSLQKRPSSSRRTSGNHFSCLCSECYVYFQIIFFF